MGEGRNTTVSLPCITCLLSALSIMPLAEFHYLPLWLLHETTRGYRAYGKFHVAK
jgi:hypothetical protein